MYPVLGHTPQADRYLSKNLLEHRLSLWTVLLGLLQGSKTLHSSQMTRGMPSFNPLMLSLELAPYT